MNEFPIKPISQPKGISFRFVEFGDRALLTRFRCGGSVPADEVELEIRKYLFDSWVKTSHTNYSPDKVEIFLALHDDKLVGLAAYNSHLKHKSVLSQLIAVEPEYRRQKIGTYLKTLVMNEALGLGASFLISVVRSENIAMRAVNDRWKHELEESEDAPGFVATAIPIAAAADTANSFPSDS